MWIEDTQLTFMSHLYLCRDIKYIKWDVLLSKLVNSHRVHFTRVLFFISSFDLLLCTSLITNRGHASVSECAPLVSRLLLLQNIGRAAVPACSETSRASADSRLLKTPF